MNTRALVLALGLAGTIVWSLMLALANNDGHVEISQAVVPADLPGVGSSRQPEFTSAAPSLRRDVITDWGGSDNTLFSIHQPAPVPVATPVATPPLAPAPAPVAPPMPFTLLGAMRDAQGVWVAYLVRGDAVVLARMGERIDDAYRVDEIQDGNVTMTYLPLEEKQLLRTPGS